jgi:hypothetical protein
VAVTNNEHAARLREMAEREDLLAKSYAETAPEVFAAYERRSAALLAGAEALEAVEVAKVALETIRDRCRSAGQGAAYGELKDIREYVPDDMRQCDDVATAALARLEGK